MVAIESAPATAAAVEGDPQPSQPTQTQSHSNLCVLAVYLFVLLYLFSTLQVHAACVTPFGSVIGLDSTNVPAFSNCNDSYVSDEPSFVNQSIYSGMQWQCVEYSRRYLIQNYHLTFESVDYAWQIFGLSTLTATDGNLTVPFNTFKNGGTTVNPSVGCLLIYAKELDGVTGHVAVIVNVARDFIWVAEQNWDNADWKGKSYSRQLPSSINAGGLVSVNDSFVIGWKCVGK